MRNWRMTIVWKDNEWFLERLIEDVIKVLKRWASSAQIARLGLCYHEENLVCNFPWVHVVISRHSKAYTLLECGCLACQNAEQW